jgi:Fe-S-cluster containining protein
MQPPDADKIEQKRIEAKGFRDFLEQPDEGGIRWIKRKNDGCFFLKNGKCAIYDIRPATCRLEPFTIVDYDYEKNLIELALNFPFSECCAGVFEGEKLRKEEIAVAARIVLQKILELTAFDLDLPVTDEKVHAQTRSRLLQRTAEAADLHV